VLAENTGLRLLWWSGPILIFAIVPLLDLLIGKDSENPPDSVIAALEQDRYYRWCVYLFLPLQFASLATACAIWSWGTLSPLDSLGLATTLGIVGGVGINTAHELGHKSERRERWLSKIALSQAGYGHFYVEHNRGHHVRVATPEDPASSRLGESFWAFLPRRVAGSAASAWAMTVALYGGLSAVFGISVLPWLLVQAMVGISLLEVVNYLEHYGLARQKRPDGRCGPCAPRHSDHHTYPSRPYQTLRTLDEAPELPSGYGAMAVLALLPPLWRRIMDPKVKAHYRGEVTLANVHPPKRKRYGPE
jgi:alkane 1-monooxygenase